ncbi:MAG: ATP-binding protein [Endomicrobiia bacterium]
MSLKNVFGQKQAVDLLTNEIKTGNVKHSYIFYGIKGIGKKFTALEFAKTLLCEDKKDIHSCDECISCIKIKDNTHPDVFIIDSEYQEKLLDKVDKQKNIKIDTIRYIKEQASLSPYLGKYKIFIIDQAETLQKEAANSLLKLLEEPPKNCIIILVTSLLGILPKTIVSRCELVKFLPLSRDVIKNLVYNDIEIFFNSMEDLFYSQRISKFLDILEKNPSLAEIQNIADELKKDKELAKNFVAKITEKFLHQQYNNELFYDFLKDIEFCLKEFRYNIDVGLLIETFLVKTRLILCNKSR